MFAYLLKRKQVNSASYHQKSNVYLMLSSNQSSLLTYNHMYVCLFTNKFAFFRRCFPGKHLSAPQFPGRSGVSVSSRTLQEEGEGGCAVVDGSQLSGGILNGCHDDGFSLVVENRASTRSNLGTFFDFEREGTKTRWGWGPE
jgi:hypothetical protein